MLSKSSVTSSTTCLFPVCTDRLLCKRSRFSINGVCWFFHLLDVPSSFLLICYEDKWFVLPQYYSGTSLVSHSFNIWTFLHVSTRQCPGSPCAQSDCTAVGRDAGLHRAAVYWLTNSADFNMVDYTRSRAFCNSEYQIRDVDHLKERQIYEWRRFDQRIIDRAVSQW